jgi:alcohol dehydrogenase class IV
MEVNLRAARARQPSGETVRRYTEVARLLTGHATASADDGVRFVRDLVTELQIPPLRTYGLLAEHTAGLVTEAARASSTKANPLPLTPEELAEILTRAL